ncbi:hypothetical protein FNYG_15609 [Fusarium nygamai]|uniref:Uncharacterized protein n=1 Tax=Gibberella nygamai TaxID=42673 RepID=A0A2K0UAJ1_GIBNY|nr:hypothetical protein FNYG_15609 [Fusarium nygamai]
MRKVDAKDGCIRPGASQKRAMANACKTERFIDDMERPAMEKKQGPPSKKPRWEVSGEMANRNIHQTSITSNRTGTRLNNFSSSSQQANKRGQLENTIPVAMPPAAKISDKKRSDKDKGEVRQLTPSTSPDTKSESSPPSPEPFFTDDGDHALLALTLHLSRRTANLEEMRRRCPIIVENDTAQPLELSNQSSSSLNPSLPDDNLSHSPPPKELAGPRASQETYGGDWVDDCADELWMKGPH